MEKSVPADSARVSLVRIMRLFTPYRVKLGVALGLIVASSVLGLLSPFLLRDILDVALPRGATGLLSLLAVCMFALVVLGNCIGVWQSYLSLTIGENVMNDLRVAVYTRLQRMSLAFFTRTHTGEVQSRIANDIGGMAGTITSLSASTVSSVTAVVGSLIAMLVLDWQLTLVSLLILPFFVLISRKVGDERRKVTMKRQQQMALLSILVEESLSVSGFLLGRVMGRVPVLTDEYTRHSSKLTDLTIRSSMTGRWRAVSIQLVMAGTPIAIYWLAGLTGDHGRLAVSIGTLVAFTTLQQGLFGPAVALLQVGITIQSSLALFERIFGYLDLPIQMPEPALPVAIDEPEGHVRFDDVHFSYDGRKILHGITIDIAPKNHLAIVGATGAGKTTLGYLVPRLYDVTSGQVTIDGVDVRDLSFATLSGIVGVVSQETHLFHTTIGDNLRFARPEASEGEVVEAAKSAQIHDLIESLPDGYDTVVGERGYRFSGGEKQRMAIARVMLRNPRVLVLDEATSALDTRTERAVQQALDRLSAGRTTITIAHRLSTVEAADHIVVLDHGRVVEQGSHAELLDYRGYYAALLAPRTRRPEHVT